jgi:hypothetical protein
MLSRGSILHSLRPIATTAFLLFFVLLVSPSQAPSQAVSVEDLMERNVKERNAGESVESLVNRATHENDTSKLGAIIELGSRKAQGAPGLPAIVEAVKNKNWGRDPNWRLDARVSAIGAIAEIIYEPNPNDQAMKDAVPPLISVIPTVTELLRDSDSYNRRVSVFALLSIANLMQVMKAIDAVPNLKQAVSALEQSNYPEVRRTADAIRDVVLYLNLLWLKGLLPKLTKEYPKVFIVLVAYLTLLILTLALFVAYPKGLLQINERLSDSVEFSLPSWAGGIKLPLRYLLLVGFFHFRPRVLDAWTRTYLETAQRVFSAKITVQEREIFVPTTVEFNGDMLAELEPADLQPVFSQNQGLLFIVGEGGIGKTSLACILAKSGMRSGKEARLCKQHPVLPILLEQDLDGAATDDKILKLIKNQLKILIDVAEAPSERLVRQLLKRRRILVVVDGLSEFSDTSRFLLKTAIVEIPINSALITSRSNEPLFDDLSLSVVRPSRIQENNVSMFFGAYFTKRRKRHLFSDSEFFSICQQFTSMVKGTGGTALFAKLYSEQVIAIKDRPEHDDLPLTIPDLMLCYINHLNRGANIENRIVHSFAKKLAWECVKKTFRPSSARRADVIQALGNNLSASTMLLHLENNLKIIRTGGFVRDSLRFTLDPFSEYLAGLHLVQEYGGNRELWADFFHRADGMKGAPHSIKYFLMAVRDCCIASGEETDLPSFVIDELTQRIRSSANRLI